MTALEDEAARLRAEARGSVVDAWTMLAISLLFLVAVGYTGRWHYWEAAGWSAAGAILFAWLAGVQKQDARRTRARADELDGQLLDALIEVRS